MKLTADQKASLSIWIKHKRYKDDEIQEMTKLTVCDLLVWERIACLCLYIEEQGDPRT